VARSLAELATNALLVFLTMIFLLFEASGFTEKLRRAFGFGDEASGALYAALQRIQKYLVIKTGVSLVTGLLIAVGLAILQVKFAILLGLLAFLLNYIPNLGSIIAAVPAVVMALVDEDPFTALLTAALFLVVNISIGNVIEPNLMGRRMGLSTLVVFLSLLFWGWVWGPVGMLLSVPLTMTLKILLENVEDFRWVAILMSKNPPPPPPSP
jgi:predicted PurR-regulated permease PerM